VGRWSTCWSRSVGDYV